MAARSTPLRNTQHRPTAAAGLRMQIVGVEVMMNGRLATWTILAGGIAMVAVAFFASAGVTHWVMGLRHTVVVVRPGPTVYLPSPTGHGHTRDRTAGDPAPAVPDYGGGGIPSQQDAHARRDHKGAHARPHHRGHHARRHHKAAHFRLDHGRKHPPGPGPGAAHHPGGRGVNHDHGNWAGHGATWEQPAAVTPDQT